MAKWTPVTENEIDKSQEFAAEDLLLKLRNINGATATFATLDDEQRVVEFVSVFDVGISPVGCCFRDGEVIWIERREMENINV